MPETTRYKDIFKHLKDEGFDIHTPAQAHGECKKPYIVIKDSGGEKMFNFSTSQNYYDIMCYVPKNEYTKLGEYMDEVTESMKELEPMIKPTNFRTPSFYDDTVKAHMMSTQYYNYRKL